MINLYLNLEEVAQFLLTKDKTVVSYTEIEYTEDFLDSFYNFIKECEVDRVVILVHGFYCTTSDSNNFVACDITVNGSKYYCNVSNDDINALLKVCEKSGVREFKIVDFLGYCAALGLNDTSFVMPYGDMTEVVTVSNGIKDIVYIRPINLEGNLLQNKRNYGVSKFIDINTYADATLVGKFVGTESIQDKRALVGISKLAYTETEASEYFTLLHRVNKEVAAHTHS